MPKITREDILYYEISNGPAEYISIGWIQEIFARYYAKKVNRKYRRYLLALDRQEWIKQYQNELGKTN